MKDLLKYYISVLVAGILGCLIAGFFSGEAFSEESIQVAILIVFVIDTIFCGIFAIVRHLSSGNGNKS